MLLTGRWLAWVAWVEVAGEYRRAGRAEPFRPKTGGEENGVSPRCAIFLPRKEFFYSIRHASEQGGGEREGRSSLRPRKSSFPSRPNRILMIDGEPNQVLFRQKDFIHCINVL